MKKNQPAEGSLGSVGSCVHTPSLVDVLFGRGTQIEEHRGNKRFRGNIQAQSHAYSIVSNRLKHSIARNIFLDVKNSGGRFLRKISIQETPKESRVVVAWEILSDDAVIAKIKQALRDEAAAAREDNAARAILHQQQRSGQFMTSSRLSNTKYMEPEPRSVPSFMVEGWNTKESHQEALRPSSLEIDQRFASLLQQQRAQLAAQLEPRPLPPVDPTSYASHAMDGVQQRRSSLQQVVKHEQFHPRTSLPWSYRFDAFQQELVPDTMHAVSLLNQSATEPNWPPREPDIPKGTERIHPFQTESCEFSSSLEAQNQSSPDELEKAALPSSNLSPEEKLMRSYLEGLDRFDPTERQSQYSCANEGASPSGPQKRKAPPPADSKNPKHSSSREL